MNLTRYWFEFEAGLGNYDLPHGTKVGCGVTAYNYDEALNLLKIQVFKFSTMPVIKAVIENVDVSILDHNHILLNMATPTIRGVWFPLGYQ